MPVDAIWSPKTWAFGGSGYTPVTMWIEPPWQGAWFVHCTTNYVTGDGPREFGIIELHYMDSAGNPQMDPFGNWEHWGNFLVRGGREQLTGVMFGGRTFDAAMRAAATFFHFG
jgi:hypothetical protein